MLPLAPLYGLLQAPEVSDQAKARFPLGRPAKIPPSEL
jgi:hypothetical protein